MYNPKSSRYRWVIQALLILVQLSIGINILAPAPMFPLIMDDFGLGRSTVSLMIALVALMLAIGNVPSGFLAARFGLHKTVFAGAVLMSAGVFSPLASSFPVLLALRVVFGLGVGIVIPLVGAVTSQWFGQRELPVASGLNWTGQTGGMAISMFLSVPLANIFGWTSVLFIYSLVPLALAFAWFILGRDPQPDRMSAPTTSVVELLRVARERTTLLLVLAVVGPFFAYISLNSWLPTYYHEVLGFSLTRAGFMVGLLPLTGIAANVFVAVVPAKVGLRRPFLIWPGLIYVFAAFGTFLFNSDSAIYVSIVVLGFVQWMFMPMVFTVAMELPGKSPEKVAMIIGTALTIGNMVSLAGPILIGATTDAIGSYIPGFSVLALAPLTLLLAGILLPETGPRSGKRSPDSHAVEQRPASRLD